MAKTVIVTGATRGIGDAIARELAANGYNVAVISRHLDEAKKTADELNCLYHTTCIGYECDVADSSTVRRTFADISSKLGTIDALVNNAGTNARTKIADLAALDANLDGAMEEMGTNYFGALICSTVAADYMRQSGGGVIINVSSIKARDQTSGYYGASKAAVEKMTIDHANAWAQYGIRVNCVAPGFIDTGMTAELPDDKKAVYMAQIPMKRFGTVEEVAKVVAFLASDEASYITGAVIPVNGGLRMG